MSGQRSRALQALAFAAIAATGCEHTRADTSEPPTFDVTRVVRRDVDIVREFVCQIRAHQHIEVRAIESGYLSRIFVDEGQRVEQGQRLFEILPVVYRAELDVADAELRRAEVQYRTTQMLGQSNVVSQAEVALAEAELRQREAQRRLAETHLRFTTIQAPFAGIVGRLMVRRGSLLEEGELLTVLSDNSQMWVYFNVSEADYLAYRRQHEVGEPVPVRLRMANGEMFPHPGTIQTIEADFNNETGTIAFRAGFANPEGLLRHGQTGEILMTTSLPDVLVVPQAATFHVLDRLYVFVVGDDRVVHARPIQVAEEVPHLFVVREGLAEGERVLVEGLRRVRDGDAIEPHERNLDDVLDELEHLHAE